MADTDFTHFQYDEIEGHTVRSRNRGDGLIVRYYTVSGPVDYQTGGVPFRPIEWGVESPKSFVGERYHGDPYLEYDFATGMILAKDAAGVEIVNGTDLSDVTFIVQVRGTPRNHDA